MLAVEVLGEDLREARAGLLVREAVEVREINTHAGDVLDYEREPSLKAIAVGGNKLSRGLTLEGLTVSYFLRNSMMYDTLMQMGRWFGYRSGYEDLCRVWMPANGVGWYAHIHEAMDDLQAILPQAIAHRLVPVSGAGRGRREQVRAMLQAVPLP